MPIAETRFVDYNYTFQENVNVTGSTESAQFPAENLKHYFRSKVWRSNADGFFRIVTTNRKLNFNIGGGELTITLTLGEYTASSLATHITTLMTAAAGVAVTCSKSQTTGKFSFTKASGTLNLLSNTGTDVANGVWDTIGFDESSDYTGALTYTGAYIANHSEEFVQLDLLTTEAVDTFYVIFDPTVGNKLTSEAVVTIQGSATSNWSTPGVSVVVPFDEVRGVYSYVWTVDQSYRYWRVKIVDPKNPDLYVELPKVIIGKSTILSRAPEFGFNYKFRDLSNTQVTPYGNVFVDVYPIIADIDLTFKLMTEDDVDTLSEVYRRNGGSVPLLIVLDAQEALFDKDRFIIYGYFASELSYKNIINDLFEINIKMTEAM